MVVDRGRKAGLRRFEVDFEELCLLELECVAQPEAIAGKISMVRALEVVEKRRIVEMSMPCLKKNAWKEGGEEIV